jgi:hypothetical protein
MADENVPLSWYAILNGNIQPYLDEFEFMKDPRLEPLDVNGRKCGKLTYSAFDGYVDYEGVLHETQELVALLTGTLRISQGPGGPCPLLTSWGFSRMGERKNSHRMGGLSGSAWI